VLVRRLFEEVLVLALEHVLRDITRGSISDITRDAMYRLCRQGGPQAFCTTNRSGSSAGFAIFESSF